MELRLIIAYSLIAATALAIVVVTYVVQRRRAARRLRLRGIKVGQQHGQPRRSAT